MEKQSLLINEDYHHLLISASVDKELTGNQFRVLFYISTNIENILVAQMQKDLNFKTTNLMSDSIKALIKNGYIKRVRNKKIIKKGIPFYAYELNLNKALFPKNLNSMVFNDYNENIELVFKYFFEKIPTSKKIDISANRKAIELLIFKDDYEVELIKRVIDFVSNSKHKYKITRPILLRKNFKTLYDELIELSIKSNI